MTRTPENGWSFEQQETLERMTRNGASAREVAAVLGKTRSAVIGRAHRTNVPLNGGSTDRVPKPRKPRVAKVPQRKRTEIPDHLREIFAAEKKLRKEPEDNRVVAPCGIPAPDGSRAVSLINLKADQCKYILENELYCGHPKIDGSSFCEYHHTICRVPRRPGANRPWSRTASRIW